MKSDFFKSSDGVRLHVLESQTRPASAKAPVLALIPGWSMPAAIWEPQFTGLSGKHRVVAMDPRGQGRSEIPAQGYTVEVGSPGTELEFAL